jgi:hypothetical protein
MQNFLKVASLDVGKDRFMINQIDQINIEIKRCIIAFMQQRKAIEGGA